VGRNLMSSPLFPRNKEEDEEDTKPMDSTIAAARPAGELVHEQGFPPLKEHDVLLRQVSTWMEELTRTREDLQRASVSIKYRILDPGVVVSPVSSLLLVLQTLLVRHHSCPIVVL
jgi:hypothetical protein